MKTTSIVPSVLLAIAISVVMAFTVIEPANAQEPAPQYQPTLEQEAFRTELDEYLHYLALAAPSIPGYDPVLVYQLEESRELLGQLSAEELQVMKDAFDRYPDAWLLGEVMELSRLYGTDPAEYLVQALETGSGSTSLTSHTCPAGVPPAAVAVVQIIDLSLEGINDAINDGLTVVLPIVGGITIPNPVKIAASILWFIDRGVLLGFEIANAANEECETNNLQAIVHDIVGPNVNATVDSRATQSSLDSHDTALATHDTDIKALLATIQSGIDENGEKLDQIIDLLLTPTGIRPEFNQ